MITLGLDPSMTGFGWCVHNSSVAGSGRVLDKGVFSTSAKDIFVSRYKYLREAVRSLIQTFPEVEKVGVESPPFGESWSEGLYGLFLYVNEALYDERKDVVYFDPSRVKLLARVDPSIRKGAMHKQDMIQAAKAETSISRWNHNEADAYIIARSAARFWEFYEGTLKYDELTPAEQKVFYQRHTFTRGKKAGKTVEHGLVFKESDRFFVFSKVPLDSKR